MRSSFPSREALSRLPIHALRVVDIREKDEEELVQEILNAKIASSPAPASIDLPFVDITTKEQEDARQKEIDELNLKSRESLLQGELVESGSISDAAVLIPEGELAQPEVTPVVKKKGRPKKIK